MIIRPVQGRAGNLSQLRESAFGLDCSVPNSCPGCVRFGAGCRTKHFKAGVKWNWGFCRDVSLHFSVPVLDFHSGQCASSGWKCNAEELKCMNVGSPVMGWDQSKHVYAVVLGKKCIEKA